MTPLADSRAPSDDAVIRRRPGALPAVADKGPRAHLVLVRAARAEPPLDGSGAVRAGAQVRERPPAAARQPALGLVLPLRPMLARSAPADPDAIAWGRGNTAADRYELPMNRRHTRRDELPEPGAWARVLVPRILEVVDGRRPVGQIRPWADDRVLATLSVVATGARRRTATEANRVVRSLPPVLRSVHVCEPADGVAEVAARFSGADRSRALAMRLEGRDGRWCAVSLRLG